MGEVDKYCVRCRLVCQIGCFKINRKSEFNKIRENCLTKMRISQRENKEAIAMLRKTIIKVIKKLFAIHQDRGDWITQKSVLSYTGHIIRKI